MKKIAILTAAANANAEPAAERLYAYLRENMTDCDVVIIYMRDLEFCIRNQNASIVDSRSGLDLKDFDFVYTKFWRGYEEEAYCIGMYLNKHDISSIPSAFRQTYMLTKITQYFGMWTAQIPVPDTYFSPKNFRLKEMIELAQSDGHAKCVVKDRHGGKGNSNYLVESTDQADGIVANDGHLEFVVQGFVENNSDYRMLVFGNKVRLIIERSRDENSQTHLNNTSQGAKAWTIEVADFDQSLVQLSESVAKLFGRDFSGVDLLISSTGEPFILEINESPQIGSGEMLEKKYPTLLEYLQEQVK